MHSMNFTRVALAFMYVPMYCSHSITPKVNTIAISERFARDGDGGVSARARLCVCVCVSKGLCDGGVELHQGALCP